MPENSYDLDNGLSVVLSDLSRHYYGGYWHVIFELRAVIRVTEESFDSSVDFQQARQILGESVDFLRRIEKMAVPSSDIETVKDELLKRVKDNMLPLLSSEKFSARFLATEYKLRLKKNLRGIPCRL